MTARRGSSRQERQRRMLLDEASAALRSGDTRRAEMLARRLLDVDPLDAAALDVVVRALLARGDVPSALYESERALLITPGRAPTLVTRARVLLAADRSWEALDVARSALDLAPDIASWHMLVVATRATGDVLSAAEAAEEMTARFPDDPGGPLLLAGLAEETSAVEEARDAYGRALALMAADDPRRAAIADRRAQLNADASRPPAVPPPPPPSAGQSRGEVAPGAPEPSDDDPDAIIDLRTLAGEPQRRSLSVARWLDRLR